jgi:hypothetical protein
MKKSLIVIVAAWLVFLSSIVIYAQAPIEPKAFDFQKQEINGQTAVRRTAVAEDEKQRLDQQRIADLQNKLLTEGLIQQPQGQQQAQDPHAVAAWTYWWEQMKLWQTYVKDRLFHRPLDTDIKDINFATQDTVKQSVDADANTLVVQSEQINDEQHQENLQFLERLRAREDQRTAYEDWVRAKQQDLVLDFAEPWVKRMKGDIVSIDGNVYLISSEPLQRVPRNAINIVTHKLTPYDLINPDGSLKVLPKE